MPRKPTSVFQVWHQKKIEEIEEIEAALTGLGSMLGRKVRRAAAKSRVEPLVTAHTETQSVSQFSNTTPPKKLLTLPVIKARAKSVQPVKKVQQERKVTASTHTDDHLPSIQSKNRAQFWQTRNKKAVDAYRLLTDNEKLERAVKLQLAYEEEVGSLKAQSLP